MCIQFRSFQRWTRGAWCDEKLPKQHKMQSEEFRWPKGRRVSEVETAFSIRILCRSANASSVPRSSTVHVDLVRFWNGAIFSRLDRDFGVPRSIASGRGETHCDSGRMEFPCSRSVPNWRADHRETQPCEAILLRATTGGGVGASSSVSCLSDTTFAPRVSEWGARPCKIDIVTVLILTLRWRFRPPRRGLVPCSFVEALSTGSIKSLTSPVINHKSCHVCD